MRYFTEGVMKVGYVRISTQDQSHDLQIRPLVLFAKKKPTPLFQIKTLQNRSRSSLAIPFPECQSDLLQRVWQGASLWDFGQAE